MMEILRRVFIYYMLYHCLQYLSTIKYAGNFISGSVQVARAQWINKWVLILRAGIARASSGALNMGLAKLQDWRSLNYIDTDARTFRSNAPSPSSYRPPSHIEDTAPMEMDID